LTISQNHSPTLRFCAGAQIFYRHTHPMPADVLLIIEVADSTVETDRSYKMPLYAKAGIPEAWIVNLQDETIELYAEPVGGIYQSSKTFKRGEDVQAHGISELRVRVEDILG
jgi:Uma2 family endonuclease